MLMSILAGCSASPWPVQTARFFPAAPVAPVIAPLQSAPELLAALPAAPVDTPLQPAPESPTELKNMSASPPSEQRTEAQFEPRLVVRSARSVQTGIASWYGPGFHGKRTANGETYNQYALTAAHRSLPLGTRVIVTNIESGQAVEVRINDRGPFVKGRIIDLSFAAAKSIGVYTPGTAPVRVEVLSAPTPRLSVLYAVQVGAYTDADKASALKHFLTKRFSPVYISLLSTGRFRYYQVRLGPFTARPHAEHQASFVAQAGLQGIVVEEDDRWAEW